MLLFKKLINLKIIMYAQKIQYITTCTSHREISGTSPYQSRVIIIQNTKY